ncbi:MAG: tetratricopeptide repeat protein [Rhodanobacteraceae bacterium]
MAPDKPGLFEELKRRHVLRAAIIYVAAVWALSQGISQLSPAFGLSTQVTLWFVIACAIGFPFWVAFAWCFKFTPHGIAREDDIPEDAAAIRRLARKLDYWIIGILAVAVVLLLTNQLVLQRGKTLREFAAAGNALPAPTAAVPAKSVAVLPFVNESGKQGEQFFSDGLSEDLITALSQFAGLKVISRDSAFQFRNSTDSSAKIGRLLGVAHLLEGSVQRAGDEVRITATLVSAANGSVVWSQRYDKPYTDLFALQDAITQAVADALKAKLLTTPGAVVQSDRPPSGNLDAYAAFLQGQAAMVLGDICGGESGALGDFRNAIRLDPRYALAWVRLSQCWVGKFRVGHTAADGPQDIAHARAAINTALTLDPNLAAAHTGHAFLLYSMDFDWYGAEAEYRRALQLAPGSSEAKAGLADVLATLGQLHAAIGLRRAALAIDPRNVRGWLWLAGMLVSNGQLADAEHAIRKGLALSPGVSNSYVQLAEIEVLRGHAQQAMAFACEEPSPGWRRYGVALAAQIGPDRTVADAALQTLITQDADTSAYQIAEVYALRRDPDDTFHWLDRAWAQSDSGIQELLTDPFILRYRNDPRFAAFCKKVGLPTIDAAAMKGGTRSGGIR